jgi:hypothetical protein
MVLATAAGFALLTLAWLWPLPLHVRSSYLAAAADPSGLARTDAMLTSWMLAWGTHALRTDPIGLFHANILHPLPWTFALSEHLIAGALLVMPVDVLWHDPVLDDNALLLASFVLCGLGTTLLVRELGGGWAAAWLAGALVAFNPFRVATIGHVHALSTQWMPFALLAIHRCLRRGRGAVAVALTVLAVTLSSVYYAYFFLIALAVFVPTHALLGCPAAPGGRRRVVAGIAVAAAVTGVVLLPYLIARDLYALEHPEGEAWFFAAKGVTYLGALAEPLTYGFLRFVARQSGLTVIGPGMFVLAAVGLVAGAAPERGGRRTALAYLATGTALALVSLGPLMQWHGGIDPSLPGLWKVLAAVVPGFEALRVPMRASTVAILAMAVLAGFGAQTLWARARTPRARAWTAFALVVAVAVDTWRPPFTLVPAPAAATAPPVYRWLAEQPGRDAIVELPVGNPVLDATYQTRSATHWRPIVNGVSGFAPTISFFRGFLFQFPSPPTIRLLHQIGVRWVVVHPADMAPMQRGLCDLDPSVVAPYAAVVYRDAASCVFEIRSAPPAPNPTPDDPVLPDGVTVTASPPEGAEAALDGRLDTHWTTAIDPKHETWLQLDLPAPRTITRLVLHQGSHFGEYMRLWRVDVSLDGSTWSTAAIDRNGMPPVVDLRTAPENLTQELRLVPPASARHLRIVQLDMKSAPPSLDLWANWMRWGVHEIDIYAVPSRGSGRGAPQE